MVKVERSFPAPDSLAEESGKVNGRYDKQLEKIHKNPGSKAALRTVRSLLRRESAFAAFKRCYVREHRKEYPELWQYVTLDGE